MSVEAKTEALKSALNEVFEPLVQEIRALTQRCSDQQRIMSVQIQQQQQILQQNQQMLSMLGTISAQLDGIAQRSDYLYDQMGRLGQVMSVDGSPQAAQLPYPTGEYAPPGIENMLRSAGREVVDNMVEGFFPRGGGGRPRRR